MEFGTFPLEQALGLVLAHSVKAEGVSFKKGRVLSEVDVDALCSAGVKEVIGARLGEDELGEDRAADGLADLLSGGNGIEARPAFTGRANLFAAHAGVFRVSSELVNTFNRLDESITLATVEDYATVEVGQMVATLKIIPLAVPRTAYVRAEEVAQGGMMTVAPFRKRPVGMVQTVLPATNEKMLTKTVEVTTARLAQLGLSLIAEHRTAHDSAAVAEAMAQQKAAGAELILLVGASAIVDRRDVLPAAVERVGGVVEHFGMPVDPGNLILTGRWHEIPVIGMPGCARSPKLNGFDWALARLAADLPVSRQEITGMGVGGLLKEIDTRPSPRAGKGPDGGRSRPKIAGIILAGGSSRRMGDVNKLLIEIDGKPLIRRVAERVLAAPLTGVTLVVGHEAEAISQAVEGLDLTLVSAPEHQEGLAASLRTGAQSLLNAPDLDGVVVCLGDMPDVSATVIDRLIGAFDPLEGRAICIPTHHGRRGNPVLLAKSYLEALTHLKGDVGAKHIIASNPDLVAEVEMPDPAILVDLDTPEALAHYQETNT